MNEGKGSTRLYTFAPNIEFIKKKRGENGVNMVLADLKRKRYDLILAASKNPTGYP